MILENYVFQENVIVLCLPRNLFLYQTNGRCSKYLKKIMKHNILANRAYKHTVHCQQVISFQDKEYYAEYITSIHCLLFFELLIFALLRTLSPSSKHPSITFKVFLFLSSKFIHSFFIYFVQPFNSHSFSLYRQPQLMTPVGSMQLPLLSDVVIKCNIM